MPGKINRRCRAWIEEGRSDAFYWRQAGLTVLPLAIESLFVMTVDCSRTLSSLIAGYEEAVVFEESTPPAYQLARLFMRMRSSNGGLVLFGVDSGGRVVGVTPRDAERIYAKFERLCAELARSCVEIGTLRLDQRLVVFLVFNPIPRNLRPLDRYAGCVERLEHI